MFGNRLGETQRRAKRLIETISDRITQKREDIRKMFIKMDSHKHGSLSYKEFREGLDAAGVHLSDDDFSIVAREVDPVGDGRIEFVEFARAVKRDQRKASDATVSPQKTNVAFLRDDGYEEDGVDEGGLTTELYALFWLGLG